MDHALQVTRRDKVAVHYDGGRFAVTVLALPYDVVLASPLAVSDHLSANGLFLALEEEDWVAGVASDVEAALCCPDEETVTVGVVVEFVDSPSTTGAA